MSKEYNEKSLEKYKKLKQEYEGIQQQINEVLQNDKVKSYYDFVQDYNSLLYSSYIEKDKKTIKKLKRKMLQIKSQMHLLLSCAEVKRYLQLVDEAVDIRERIEDVYVSAKTKMYEDCNHIWVIHQENYDSFEGRTCKEFGCIKCGLDSSVLEEGAGRYYDFLTKEKRIQYDVLREMRKTYFPGIHTSIKCDFDLAKAICAKIREAHPQIDDEKIIRYLEVALYDIRTIPINKERQMSRARRLSLPLDYSKWNIKDIHKFL